MKEQNHIDQTQFDQHAQDLLHGSIDGELSKTEQEELDRLLAGSDKLCALNAELKTFNCLLDELPELEPPGYLQSAIERQIRLPVDSSVFEEKQGFFGTWLPAHWVRTGFALAAGAVLTIGVYEMGSEPMTAQDAANMVGTMVDNRANNQGELLDSVHIFTDMLNGSVELRSNEEFFNLDVQLNSDGPTQVVVNFAERGLEFEGITRKQDRKDTISIADGAINVTSSGEQSYILQLRRSSKAQQAAPLELEFFANNILVHEASLNILQQ